MLEEMGITKTGLPEMTAQELEETLGTLIELNATLFIKFLYSQGYDLWLT